MQCTFSRHFAPDLTTACRAIGISLSFNIAMYSEFIGLPPGKLLPGTYFVKSQLSQEDFLVYRPRPVIERVAEIDVVAEFG